MTAIINLHLEFVGGEPPEWRLLQVAEDTTLAELHSLIRDVFDELPEGSEFMHWDDSFGLDSETSVRRAFGPHGNRIDLISGDESNPLVIWHDGVAMPEENAYPRLAAGGEKLLDERDPFEASTVAARPLDGARDGEWDSAELDASLGADMLERFLNANDLGESARAAFEELKSDDELFAEFEWATRRLGSVEDGVSPRMRRAYHELRDAGIPVEIGLLQQLERTELYRADTPAIGHVADILAGLEVKEAVEPIVELLKLSPETNPRAFVSLVHAVVDLDGPEFERVFELLEEEPPVRWLDTLAAISNFSRENPRLAGRLFELVDELEDHGDKDFAMTVLIERHPESSGDQILGLLDDFIAKADEAIEQPDELLRVISGDLLKARTAIFFADGLDGSEISIGESRREAIERIRAVHDEILADDAGTFRGGDEPGRNDPCPCGSGKKYKKCCMRK